MASITKIKRKGGTAYRIEFFDVKRKFIRLSTNYKVRTAQAVKEAVERLVTIRNNGLVFDKKTVDIIDNFPPEIVDKLSEVGLLASKTRPRLGEIWDRFNNLPERKEATAITYRTAAARFFREFDREETSDEITLERAQVWRAGLAATLAPATVASTVTRVRTVFKWAVENGHSEDNPFLKVEKGSFVNKERERFITPNEYERLLTACPCLEWRVIIALCRIGGLRNPSEVMGVKWADIDFQAGRFWVTSPKTARFNDKAGRLVPLFPPLRAELERLEAERENGDIYVISRNRGDKLSMRYPFKRIITLAGLEEWPRLFHNMRGSRSNELFSSYPAHVAAYWLGHSPRTAMTHYLYPLESDYRRAISGGGISGGSGGKLTEI